MNYDGMLFEVEDDDAAETEAEMQLRRRRISFYERNGVVMTEQRKQQHVCLFIGHHKSIGAQ